MTMLSFTVTLNVPPLDCKCAPDYEGCKLVELDLKCEAEFEHDGGEDYLDDCRWPADPRIGEDERNQIFGAAESAMAAENADRAASGPRDPYRAARIWTGCGF